MIGDCVEFYYAVKLLKENDLKVDFENIKNLDVISRINGKHVATFYSLDQFFGFIKCLDFVCSGYLKTKVVGPVDES